MPEPCFVHLRLHSEFSLADGITRINAAIARAVDIDMPALALTDLANLFGMIKFYKAARAAGVKPIIGCDVWIAPQNEATNGATMRTPPQRLLLLVKNHAGYLRLCDLLSLAYLGRRRLGRAEIPYAAFATGNNSGLIALSGWTFGEIGQSLVQERPEKAQQLAHYWAKLFPDSFYLEVQRPYGEAAAKDAMTDAHIQQEQLIAATVQLALTCSLPLVATQPIQFLNSDDFEAHEARVCIAEGQMLDDPRRPRLFTTEQYFKTSVEMATLFADLPQALQNSVEIARRCNLSLALGKPQLPEFPTPAGITINAHLSTLAHRGLEQRLYKLFPDELLRQEKRPLYFKRLDFEIATIQQMGFAGYFLIVADFIQWAKANGIPVGPGRGSGAGSLVAYALLITDLDPIHYDLLFERFLNPERVSMPDFDIDFCQEGRDRVIRYVKEKYGAHAVSQIVTFGTLSAKAVVRDVGRVLGIPFNEVDRFAKLIPNELEMTLEKAYTQEAEIAERLAEEQEGALPALWNLAQKLEGLTRNVGMHAGGVLIAPGKLTDFCPLYSADDGETLVSQYDKNDVESAGLVKFDFLGLRTLTILDRAVQMVAAVESTSIDLEMLPLDDQATYDEIFKTGKTTAVFQFESAGIKEVLREARPDCIEDLIALNALYRPGPMDNIPSFIRRKQGTESINYPHPKLEQILANTYGIMVYQEQVMQTAQLVANYSLGEADLLRRAMGKKDATEMAQQRAIFVDGAAQNGIREAQANAIFDTMEAFAGYGFNKSHAAAYSVVAFHTAWMKHHHPAAFMAATLSSEAANTDKVQFFFNDACQQGLKFLPPDVNSSGIHFEPVDAHTLRYGLEAVKGTGAAAITAIVEARNKGGAYTDLFDFCLRINKQKVNRRVIEALIRAGAFDSVDKHRHKLLATTAIALEAAEHAGRHALQNGLFDAPSAEGGSALTAAYADVPRWSEKEQLLNEKLALGFYFSGHPYTSYRREISRFVKRSLGNLQAEREPQLLAGLVFALRSQMTRRGKMAIITLDDGEGQIEATVFNELWEAQRHKIKTDEILLVEGRVQQDDYTAGGKRIAVDKLLTLGEARARFARSLRLRLQMNNNGSKPGDAARLKGILSSYLRSGEDGCPVRLCYSNLNVSVEIALPEAWRICLDDALLEDLSRWLGQDNVRVHYAHSAEPA